MPLPPLASVTDLANSLNTTIEDGDVTRAEQALLVASSMVRSESGSPWVDEHGDPLWAGSTDSSLLLVQETLTSVTLAAAGRAYENPSGLASVTLGPYTERYPTDASVGVYLTEDEERAIARVVGLWRGGSSTPGLWTLGTTRGDVETETVFLDTVYPNHPLLDPEPIPYRALGDPT